MPYHGMRFISRERKIKTRTAKTEYKKRERERETREKKINQQAEGAGNTYLREKDRQTERQTE